jgi:uncharacterized protein (TIGR00369 family)
LQSPTNVSPESGNDIPDGFIAADVGSGFSSRNAQFYARWANERLLLGFRVAGQHTNLRGVLHGGMLATFADTLLPYAAMYQALGGRRFLPTISLQIDYLAPAAIGAWVQGEAEVLRTTRNMVFMQGMISADKVPIARVSGIFKIGPAAGELNRDFFGIIV